MKLLVGSCLSLFCLLSVPIVITNGDVLEGLGSVLEDITGIGHSNDPGSPLFLTDYIASGQIEVGRLRCRVVNLPSVSRNDEVESYAGYITVNQELGSNIFFWFVPAANHNRSAPLMLWMQGGPGDTGFIGFFNEHGPYYVKSDLKVAKRQNFWSKNFNVIYLDNPVGVGYSFTNSEDGYVTNQEDMADAVYAFLQQFFQLFDEYKRNDFYVAGESYGGKYVPSVAYKIHSTPSSGINLKGIAMSGGFSDPVSLMDYSTHLYELGFVDANQAAQMKVYQDLAVQYIQEGRYYDSLLEFDKVLLDLNITGYPNLFTNFTGYIYTYNLLQPFAPEDTEYFKKYVVQTKFKKAVHVGNTYYQDGSRALNHLLNDIMQSVKDKVIVLMNNYKVMYYNGMLDLIVPYTHEVNFLNSVQWDRADEYKNAERIVWRLNGTGEIGGYVRTAGQFVEAAVRNAGHLLSHDNPAAAHDLITRFINDQGFN